MTNVPGGFWINFAADQGRWIGQKQSRAHHLSVQFGVPLLPQSVVPTDALQLVITEWRETSEAA